MHRKRTTPSRSVLVVGVVAVVALAACGGGGAPSSVAAKGGLEARVSGPPGVALVAACTPSGPELCFNAIDDNCNGVIDEGCGVATGALQFVLAWGDSPADIDLVVTGPSGERVDHTNRATASGLHLDRDCPNEGCSGQNIENVFFEGVDPPRGRYTVDVKLKKLQGATPPVHVRFGARVGSRSYGADVALAPGDGRDARARPGEAAGAAAARDSSGAGATERVSFTFDL